MDYNGKLAITGAIDGHVLASLMRHKYFGLYPPKRKREPKPTMRNRWAGRGFWL